MNMYQNLIKEIGKELGIKVTILSKDWVIMLEKGKKTQFICGYKFGNNDHALGLIMDDKYAMYEVLKKANIPVILHQIIFRFNNQEEYAKGVNSKKDVLDFFKKYNQNIVVKPNNSTCGIGVYHVTSEEQLWGILDKLFISNFSVSLCPYYTIKNEYRLIYQNNECVCLYGKKKPMVIGDGKKSIRTLLQEFNPIFFHNQLKEECYHLVLKSGEIFEYNWKFNLSTGAIPFELKDERLKEKLLQLGKKVTSKISLNFCSLDIIETEQGELLVMEINSGVMMKNYMQFGPSNYQKAKEIYKVAIQDLFS